MISNRILQNTLENQRQFLGRPVALLFRQAHHCVLHDVERRVVAPDRVYCLLEGAALHLGEEVRQFLRGGQDACSVL